MEVELTPDQQAKLSSLAAAQGCAEEALVREAVDRFLNGGEWFVREVDKGLAAADQGELIAQENVRRMIDSRYPGAYVDPFAKTERVVSNGNLAESIDESLYILNVSPSISSAGLLWRTRAMPLARKPFPSDVRTPRRERR